MAQGTRWRATIRWQSHRTFNDVPQAFKLLYESAAKFSQRPGSRSGSTVANTDAQTAQQSTRSERQDRCLVNAHFNLNEPRTALRKHKVREWVKKIESDPQSYGLVTVTRAFEPPAAVANKLKNRFQQETEKLSERMAIRANERLWDQPTGIAEAGFERHTQRMETLGRPSR